MDKIITKTKKQRILFLGFAYSKGRKQYNDENNDERQRSYGNEKIKYFCKTAGNDSPEILYYAGV